MLRVSVAAAAITMSSSLALAVANEAAPRARSVGVAAQVEPPSQPWAQEKSDVHVAAGVRFGTLPNGMRYALMRNATPPGQTSMWVRIDAGSLMENDNQLGLAHFMEHMAFNGTRHIPKNELVHRLERIGVAFGADLNAATGFDQTFYQLNLPKSDASTLDTAAFVLREQISEATMEPSAIDAERGVVAGEERLRNLPSLRAARKLLPILAKGQRLANRMPIGDLNIIRTAPRERFVEFYQAYYRPSRATFIAVGDFDLDAMEARVKRNFADWQPSGPAGADPDLGQVAQHAETAHMIVEPGIPPSVSLMWLSAPDLAPDTLAKRRSDYLEWLGFKVFNRRLEELSRSDDPPFINAAANSDTSAGSFQAAAVNAQFIDGRWQSALTAIEQEQRRITKYGVTQEEIDREIQSARARLRDRANAAGTRNTRSLVAEITASVNDRKVFVSPQTELEIFEASMKDATPAVVTERLRAAFKGQGPLTIVQSPVAIKGGEAAIAAAYASAHESQVAAPAPAVKEPWSYTSFGAPGKVVSRETIPALGITKVKFANGVDLWIKPTPFSKDAIGVNVIFGRGETEYISDRFDPRSTVLGAFREGGVKRYTADEMSRTLAGHSLSAGFNVSEGNFSLSGGTNRQDLQLQLQVLAAYLTEPAFRSGPFDKVRATYPQALEIGRSTPGGAFSIATRHLLAGGDMRKAYADPAEVANWSMDRYRDDLIKLVSRGPLHVNIVGDVSIDETIAAVSSTFGALPPREALPPPAPGALVRHFPAPTAHPMIVRHKGVEEQGLGFIAWPVVDAVDSRVEARHVYLLAAVLRLRVLEEIRERLGLAYSPGVTEEFSDTFRGYGSISVQAQTSPDKVPAFFDAIERITKSLRDRPIGIDELNRARAPAIEAARRAYNTNGFWMVEMGYLARRPDAASETMSTVSDLQKVTPRDIQALARKYLRPETAWRGEALPEVKGSN